VSQTEQSYNDVLGQWIAQYAEQVEDMGHRVAGVLGQDPRDHHYAGNKLGYAIGEAAKALTLAGWSADQLIELVRDGHDAGMRYKRDLDREFGEADEARGKP
jgi:hypothetical protein